MTLSERRGVRRDRPEDKAGESSVGESLLCKPKDLRSIPALGRWGQVDLCEFEANLVYIVSLGTDRAT